MSKLSFDMLILTEKPIVLQDVLLEELLATLLLLMTCINRPRSTHRFFFVNTRDVGDCAGLVGRVIVFLLGIAMLQDVGRVVLWKPFEKLLVVLLDDAYSVHDSNNYRRPVSNQNWHHFLR